MHHACVVRSVMGMVGFTAVAIAIIVLLGATTCKYILTDRQYTT